MLTILQAESVDHIAIVREFLLEYAGWLEFNLCFQGFEEELRTLPGKYAAPQGRLLLAFWDERPAGIGAVRPLNEEGVCEMKRLYVRPEFRGKGIARVMVEKLIEEACRIGYKAMRLDTVPGKMDSAIALYRDLGFQETKPYYGTPVESTLFMELRLCCEAPIIRNPQP
jgi:ribosomal protein S18 acetylase RimI-like enzyme